MPRKDIRRPALPERIVPRNNATLPADPARAGKTWLHCSGGSQGRVNDSLGSYVPAFQAFDSVCRL
jgi:hypothetical protein